MNFRSPYIFAVILGMAVIHGPSMGLAQTYNTWQNPDEASAQSDAENARLKAVLERLNGMIDQAEKDRAADPKFLQDLRDLTNELANEMNSGTSQPSSKQVLFDDFKDGDYTQSPVWTVGAGRYWIEKNWGLRNGLDEVKASSSGTTSKDAAAQIFGQILNQALGGSSSGSSSTTKPGTQPTSIFADVSIANAFSIELDLSSWVGEGEFIMGPYQGSERASGYRLTYKVGEGLALRIKSRSGSRTITLDPGPFKLEDKKVHNLLWTRATDGTMRVGLDGKTILDIRDNSFRDAFIGFGMATRGGDFIIKRVSIHAAD